MSEPAFWAGFDRGSVDGFRDYFRQLTEVEPNRLVLTFAHVHVWQLRLGGVGQGDTLGKTVNHESDEVGAGTRNLDLPFTAGIRFGGTDRTAVQFGFDGHARNRGSFIAIDLLQLAAQGFALCEGGKR